MGQQALFQAISYTLCQEYLYNFRNKNSTMLPSAGSKFKDFCAGWLWRNGAWTRKQL